METILQGTDGSDEIIVNNVGKELETVEGSLVEPKQGNNVYLSIDYDLQIAVYKILEQRIAGILKQYLSDVKSVDTSTLANTDAVPIPIYDVYNALIENSTIDISHFSAADATEREQRIYALFQQKLQQVLAEITQELTVETATVYNDLSDEMQEYETFIVDKLLSSTMGILSSTAIDEKDATYQAWNDGTISLRDYLTYAASQNWIDISKFSTEGDYLDSDEVYKALTDYLIDYLKTDNSFSKLLYKYMLQEDTISGREICLVLYEQGVLSKDDGTYEALASGAMTAYDFMINKISNLEIEPAQLALEPCSASAVITDIKTGDVLACVSYPGYDNNRLVNNMDTEYYTKLSLDQSSPFFNKATQQTAAPGSTFKILSTIAGMSEGVIDDGTYINCTGSFDLVTPPINCWNKQGHGEIEIREAIEQSCNYYFNMVGFKLGQDENGDFSENRSLSVLQKYAAEIGLDKKTGIEITESAPQVSNSYAVPSYIGQGTNAYTTSQLARYATAIATSGNVYDLTLLDRQTNSKGETLKEYEPDIINTVDVSQNVWDDIHDGMYRVVQTHKQFDGLGVDVAGKTGTAEVNIYHPNHGMFIGYAPASDPEYAIAVRIENGYASGNACLAADDIFKYIFELADEKSILTGVAASDTSDTSND